VRTPVAVRIALLTLGLAVLCAWPAAADVTLINHYRLINGDTLTRACYYSGKRVRVTGPDGREFMFNADGDTVTVIIHRRKTYWTGPRELADSLANKIIAQNRKGLSQISEMDAETWRQKMQAFNDSIKVVQTFKSRKIAGLTCDQWILTAGTYMTNDQWIARSLSVANYGPELQKVVQSSIMDPLGRVLMRLMIDMRTKSGLALAGHTTFRTLSQSGSFEFRTIQVVTGPIPKSAWKIPAGYKPTEL